MGKVIRTQKAKADLSSIWEYIAQDNPEAASKFLRKLDDKIRALSDSPEMGRSRSADLLVSGLRSFPVGHYVIYYCPIEGGVAVVRIFHAARDLESLLEE